MKPSDLDHDVQWSHQPSQPFTPARIHDGVTCEHCGREAKTEPWVGEGGVMAVVHGMTSQWCRRCILEAQIDYAERITANLPELRKQLAEQMANQPEQSAGA